jgi:anti-anti-sigma regulatory factor
MGFLGITRLAGDAAIRLDLVGELCGPDVVTLQTMIFKAILEQPSDELVVDLGRVDILGADGHEVLVSGYVVAVEYGATYRVVNARGQVLAALQAHQTADMLSDSRDLGALVLALLQRPAPGPA